MSITFDRLSTLDGHGIGIATLNSPRSLNALNLPMAQALHEQLLIWQDEPSIVCVLLRGAGEKAFCAGGDVRAIVEQQRQQPGQLHPFARDFFAHEYRLDYLIHHYRKPLIVWAHGHVMGGGMGLMQGSKWRIVTPDSQLSMPEISIGLYPDAGGSWFLNRLPNSLGLFFGLTGSRLNASDALAYGLADFLLLGEQQSALLEALQQLNWSSTPETPLNAVLNHLAQDAKKAAPAPQWPLLEQQLAQRLSAPSLPEIHQALCDLKHSSEPLLAAAAHNLSTGSPMTAWLVWEQLRRSRDLSVGQCLQMEYSMSLHCCMASDFCEGVRAKLIDKDQQPRWQWSEVTSIPRQAIEAHFTTFSEQDNPLSDLV